VCGTVAALLTLEESVRASLIAAIALLAASASAETGTTRYPMEWGGQYPEGEPVPRSLTERERVMLEAFRATQRGGPPSTPPPLGPVVCPPEYAPAEGILLAWEPSSNGIRDILTGLAVNITNAGEAKAFIYVDNSAEQSTVQSLLTTAGANMSRVQFFVATTDTIWIRDYGPRYIYEGGVRAIVDHEYNRPRPNDDLQPFSFGAARGHRVYQIPLIHGGGNYHLDQVQESFATRLIANENPGVPETEIVNRWRNYQGLGTTLTDPFPTSVDSTQHIDMWMLPVSEKVVVISDWPNNPGSTQDVICDTTADTLERRGYTVYRVPARSIGGVHYTYTNAVFCNNILILPTYTNPQMAAHNTEALNVMRQAIGAGRSVVQLNCEAIVGLSGVIHCVVMHVPKNTNGASPTAYVRTLNEGGFVEPGSTQEISWSADDDIGVTGVKVEFSPDNGQSWQTLASAQPAFGSLDWTVPTTPFTAGRIRVTATDASANTGTDMNDALLRNASLGSAFHAY
jgi:agmatine/peptidylarginine deiminase